MFYTITENIVNYILITVYPNLYEIKTIERINSTESFITYESDKEE